MKEFDRVLVGIILGGLLMVAVVFGLLFSKRVPEYQMENSPESVVHNYILAIQNEDYERAYSYLSPSLPGYPRNAGLFEYRIENAAYAFHFNREVSLVIEGANINGENGEVYVRETSYYRNDLLINSHVDRDILFSLIVESGSWKIVDGSSYFLNCWIRAAGCR